MNFLKVFYNSFFRTLGRIIVYILLGLVLSSILSKIDVHADVILNGSTLNYKDYIYVGADSTIFEIDTDDVEREYIVPVRLVKNVQSLIIS